MPLKRPTRRAAVLTQWETAYFLIVQAAGVFYAKSTITPASGQTSVTASGAQIVISRATTNTIVKGEPA